MNTKEHREEFLYRYDERLGILCQGAEPTVYEKVIAYNEAGLALEELDPCSVMLL